MHPSSSRLLSYLQRLMQDDDALHRFVVDPITSAEQNGLTKAERAVLRRSVAGLSNNSTNGYSMRRDHPSYRRSLRLLQNVLHNVGSKMVMDANHTDSTTYPYSIIVYVPICSQSTDFTKQTNADVNNFGGPYAANLGMMTVYLSSDSPTIEDVMNAAGLVYGTVHNDSGDMFVSSFTVTGSNLEEITLSADVTEYTLSDDYVFWFYTINGTPSKGGTPDPGGTPGGLGISFASQSQTLSPYDTVSWQLIAPDQTYGFTSCAPHKDNTFARIVRGLPTTG
ncbi:MAG: hypothetical protein AAFV53_12350 [Myxococcota bacterium]